MKIKATKYVLALVSDTPNISPAFWGGWSKGLVKDLEDAIIYSSVKTSSRITGRNKAGRPQLLGLEIVPLKIKVTI